MTTNVLFVDHESILGGAEISMVNIVKYMPAENVKYTAVVANYGDLYDSLNLAGAKNVYTESMDGWRWWEKGIFNRIKLYLSLPFQAYNTLRWIKLYRKLKPDLIHFNLTRLVEPVIAAKILGIPTVMHCREHQINNVSFFGGLKLHSKLINLCSFWIYNSNDTMLSLEKYKKEKVISKVIWNGVPVADFMEPSTKPITWNKKNRETSIVLMAATLVPWKNHAFAFEIAKRVLDKNNNVLFVFAGVGSREYTNSLKNMVFDLGIADNVIFPGFCNDNAALFQSADILMHTSKHESFGKIYVEAMATGIPVVALRGGAVSEVIKENFGGFLFEEDQQELFASKILELLANTEYKVEQGKLGRERAISLFSMEKHCESICNVYQSLLN
jgi:glycosyltransferase involved in cell wall biosynthesis